MSRPGIARRAPSPRDRDRAARTRARCGSGAAHSTRISVTDVRELVSSAIAGSIATGTRVYSATDATGPREPIADARHEPVVGRLQVLDRRNRARDRPRRHAAAPRTPRAGRTAPPALGRASSAHVSGRAFRYPTAPRRTAITRCTAKRPSRSAGVKPAASMLRRTSSSGARRGLGRLVGRRSRRRDRRRRTSAPPARAWARIAASPPEPSGCRRPPAAQSPPSSRRRTRSSAGTRRASRAAGRSPGCTPKRSCSAAARAAVAIRSAAGALSMVRRSCANPARRPALDGGGGIGDRVERQLGDRIEARARAALRDTRAIVDAARASASTSAHEKPDTGASPATAFACAHGRRRQRPAIRGVPVSRTSRARAAPRRRTTGRTRNWPRAGRSRACRAAAAAAHRPACRAAGCRASRRAARSRRPTAARPRSCDHDASRCRHVSCASKVKMRDSRCGQLDPRQLGPSASVRLGAGASICPPRASPAPARRGRPGRSRPARARRARRRRSPRARAGAARP